MLSITHLSLLLRTGSSLILWQIWRNDGLRTGSACVHSLTSAARPSRFVLAASLRPTGEGGSCNSICLGSSNQAEIICKVGRTSVQFAKPHLSEYYFHRKAAYESLQGYHRGILAQEARSHSVTTSIQRPLMACGLGKSCAKNESAVMGKH